MRACAHHIHWIISRTRTRECRCYTKQKLSDLLFSCNVRRKNNDAPYKNKIVASSVIVPLSSSFFSSGSSSLCDACVRREQRTGVSVVLVHWKRVGLLVVVISRVHNHTRSFLVVQSLSFSLSLSLSLSLARFLSPRVKPCYENGLLDIIHTLVGTGAIVWEIRVFKRTTRKPSEVVARNVRVSPLFPSFFVRVSVFTDTIVISFVRLLLGVSPRFVRSRFSPSTERRNVT